MGFEVNREIVAGNTLIAEAIQSQNFVAGSSGWQIAANGSAEFSQVTVRGQVFVTGTNGSFVQIRNIVPQGADIHLRGGTITNPTVEAALTAGDIFAGNNNAGTVTQNFLSLIPPHFDPTGQYPQLDMISAPYDASQMAVFRVFEPDGNAMTVELDVNAGGQVTISGALAVAQNATVAGFDIGAGIQASASSTTTSAANSTITAAAVLTISGFTFVNGRAYSIRMGGGAATSVSSSTVAADFRVFKSVAGVLGVEFGEFYRVPTPLTGAVVPAYGEIFVKNNTGANITTDVALGMASNTAGTSVTSNAGAGRQRYLVIEDKGLASAAAFTNATVVS